MDLIVYLNYNRAILDPDARADSKKGFRFFLCIDIKNYSLGSMTELFRLLQAFELLFKLF